MVHCCGGCRAQHVSHKDVLRNNIVGNGAVMDDNRVIVEWLEGRSQLSVDDASTVYGLTLGNLHNDIVFYPFSGLSPKYFDNSSRSSRSMPSSFKYKVLSTSMRCFLSKDRSIMARYKLRESAASLSSSGTTIFLISYFNWSTFRVFSKSTKKIFCSGV